MASESIKVVNSALDIDEERDAIVLRGLIDPVSLRHLRVAEYQREVNPLASINALMEAYRVGSVPDIELGMRGDNETFRMGAHYLQDPVYIIDGLQRVTAAKMLLQDGVGIPPRVGALIHFDTTEEWERERFRILNMERTKLSPNVLLRNFRHQNAAIGLLFSLSQDKTFILYDRICWRQRMRRHELITALTFLKSVGFLHSHVSPGARSSKLYDSASASEKIMNRVGKNVFRDNIRAFYDLIDQCWGIRSVAFKEGAMYMRTTFLLCLATMLSRHTNFWRGDRLFVEAPLLRKLALFPVSDPSVANLAGSGGKASDMLLFMMIEHVNSGKRTRRLEERANSEPIAIPLDIGHDDEEDEGHGVQVVA